MWQLTLYQKTLLIYRQFLLNISTGNPSEKHKPKRTVVVYMEFPNIKILGMNAAAETRKTLFVSVRL
jgi:hypothetical protein